MTFRTPALLAAAPIAAALLSLAATPGASAQVAAYGTVTAQHLGGLTYTSVGNTTNNTLVTHTDGSFSPIGGTGGLYYDFRQYGPVRLGVDARFSIAHTDHGADPYAAGSGGRLYTVMGGLRGSFPAHYRILAPYAGVDFGIARTDFGNGGSNGTSSGQIQIDHSFAYQALAGLDIHALPALDVRLFELGIGGVTGQTGQSGTHVLENLSIGVVFHLPR